MATIVKIGRVLNYRRYFLKRGLENYYVSCSYLNILPPSNANNIHTHIQSRYLSTTQTRLKDLNQSPSPTKDDDFRLKEEQKDKEYFAAAEPTKNPEKPSESTEENEKYLEVRKKILDAALPFVHAHGWTRVSIGKGAESLNYPGVIHGMFANGGVELVHYFYTDCNEKLVEMLKTKECTNPSQFAKEAIQLRLKMLQPYLKTWPQAIGLMSLPQFAPKSLAIMLTLMDDICYHSNDRSVDFSWYIRRVGLATIYKMTELYMIQDTSPGFEKTWQFLDHRMAEGVMLHNILDKTEGAGQNMQSAFATTFETARNMLGINLNRR